jgi:hypothetical protein
MELQLIESDDLFQPNPGGQQMFIDDYKNPYQALAGGWYAGKTWAGARKLANLHVENAFDAAGEPTYVKGLCVGQNYSLATQVNIPELRLAFDEMGLRYKFVADPKRFCFEFPDLGVRSRPSEMMVRSGDSPETINGFTVGHLWGDEAPRWASSETDPKRDSWLQAKGRLRDPKAKYRLALLTFTHEGDATRVYREFEEKPLPGHVLYRSGTFDNPHAKDFAETMQSQLTPELADQYLKGRAVNFRGGLIYRSFTAEHNVSADLQLDDNLSLQLALDFNINPGMHGVIGQYFEDADRVTSVHELHAPKMTVEMLLEAFASFVSTSGGWRWPTLELYGDPSGNGRFVATGETSWGIIREWFAARMPGVDVRYRIPTAAPRVADRVNAANCALRTSDGTVRWVIHPRCERLIRDLKSLKWDGNEIDKKDRQMSHASDAETYKIAWLMPVSRARPARMDYALAG